ncbi:hypothetical protein EAN94_27610 [Klebsiella pneumoniae]|nr:hypothetical protein EAN94_27610 [Klebsiella pneumoniae]
MTPAVASLEGKDRVLTDGVAAVRVMSVKLHFRATQQRAVESRDRRDFDKSVLVAISLNDNLVLT